MTNADAASDNRDFLLVVVVLVLVLENEKFEDEDEQECAMGPRPTRCVGNTGAIIRQAVFRLALLAMLIFCADDHANASPETLEITSLTVKGNAVSFSAHDKIHLSPFPEDVAIFFSAATNASHPPIRLSYKLEGYDTDWNEGEGEMFLIVRFYNETRDLIGKTEFKVRGHSAGWRQTPEDSSLTHRRETLVVPPQATRIMVVISSAGPPSTVGIYLVDDLIVSRLTPGNELQTLLRSPGDQPQRKNEPDAAADVWVRDGTHPSMAKLVELGQNPTSKALEILDDDRISHAEWHNDIPFAPKVRPGDQVVLEWNEMFSIGDSAVNVANYAKLPPGRFRFRVMDMNPIGIPTGTETSLTILVPPPFWRTVWFWGIIFVALAATIMAVGRYIILQGMRREMLRLEKQRLLEHERVRIAHDIHDDLGARVTQISLVSAMAHANTASLEQARTDFSQISQMSRDLVAALYETVWAVNPENDNLNELGNYLFQMVNQLCEPTPCRCRFYIGDLPREIAVPSQIRHNICMAVKEAVHNVIKHANASELTFRMAFTDLTLTISIQDNGGGFSAAEKSTGNGLNNLKQRLQDIGGVCQVESRPGEGTTVRLQLEVNSAGK